MTAASPRPLPGVIPAACAVQCPGVTLVTALAETSDLSDAEYRALYQRVAAGRSLRELATALRTAVSHTWWANYARGEKQLDQARKNELRAWAGLPELPPTVGEAVAAGAHADAAVYQVGAQVASRVVLVGADVPAVTLRLNGTVGVVAEARSDAVVSSVTAVSSVLAAGAGHSVRAPRMARASIHISLTLQQRLNARRLALGLTWEAFLAPLAPADEEPT